MTTNETTRIGDRRMSYTIQPCGADGRHLNGGNSYSNARTLEGARESASRMLSPDYYHAGQVASVEITGAMYEFRGCSWAPIWDRETNHHEVIRPLGPLPLSAADQAKECYDTCAMDFFERVHERRSDGSCRCGKFIAGTR